MIVENLGYYSKEKVLQMLEDNKPFGIYKTNKNTAVLIEGAALNYDVHLFYPDPSRLEYKTVEGKKISKCVLTFNSEIDDIIDFSGWNNGNQIMAYKEFIYR